MDPQGRPGTVLQQGLAQFANAQLASQLAFGLTMQALVVIVRSGQPYDVIAVKEARP